MTYLDGRTISSQALPALDCCVIRPAHVALLLLLLLLPLCCVVPPENLIIPPPLSHPSFITHQRRQAPSLYESCLVPSPCQCSITCEGYLVSTRTAPRDPTSSRGGSLKAKNSFLWSANARGPYCPRPDDAFGYI